MRRSLFAFLAWPLTFLFVSLAPALAADAIRIVYVSQISNDGQRAAIESKATRSRVAAVQAEINGDRSAVAQLRAKNVQVRNVIGVDRFSSGRTVYYVR
jgi:hypothetical protein